MEVKVAHWDVAGRLYAGRRQAARGCSSRHGGPPLLTRVPPGLRIGSKLAPTHAFQQEVREGAEQLSQ
eukprot:10485409-Alexandrium_andersonii.AAC.1